MIDGKTKLYIGKGTGPKKTRSERYNPDILINNSIVFYFVSFDNKNTILMMMLSVSINLLCTT